MFSIFTSFPAEIEKNIVDIYKFYFCLKNIILLTNWIYPK